MIVSEEHPLLVALDARVGGPGVGSKCSAHRRWMEEYLCVHVVLLTP